MFNTWDELTADAHRTYSAIYQIHRKDRTLREELTGYCTVIWRYLSLDLPHEINQKKIETEYKRLRRKYKSIERDTTSTIFRVVGRDWTDKHCVEGEELYSNTTLSRMVKAAKFAYGIWVEEGGIGHYGGLNAKDFTAIIRREGGISQCADKWDLANADESLAEASETDDETEATSTTTETTWGGGGRETEQLEVAEAAFQGADPLAMWRSLAHTAKLAKGDYVFVGKLRIGEAGVIEEVPQIMPVPNLSAA